MIFINLILFTIIIILGAHFFNIIFRGFAPYISTKPRVIKKILKEINFNINKRKVYELGCGKAGFLRALEDRKKEWQYIGVEYSWWAWLVTKIQTSFSKSKIKLLRKNIFKVNLKDADLIYCYLNPQMMKKLEIKFKEECKQGTRIISYAFAMHNLQSEKVVEVKNRENIYFYRIS